MSRVSGRRRAGVPGRAHCHVSSPSFYQHTVQQRSTPRVLHHTTLHRVTRSPPQLVHAPQRRGTLRVARARTRIHVHAHTHNAHAGTRNTRAGTPAHASRTRTRLYAQTHARTCWKTHGRAGECTQRTRAPTRAQTRARTRARAHTRARTHTLRARRTRAHARAHADARTCACVHARAEAGHDNYLIAEATMAGSQHPGPRHHLPRC